MDKSRGLNFLAGLVALWIGWRLYSLGILHDVGFMACNVEAPVRGPGAIFASLAIEAVIAIGAVSTLLVSGLWGLLVTLGSLLSDTLESAHGYLAKAQLSELTFSPEPSAPVGMDSTPAPSLISPADPADLSAVDPSTLALLSIQATRDELRQLSRDVKALMLRFRSEDSTGDGLEAV